MPVQELTVDPAVPEGAPLDAAVRALTAGGLVAFPTDTLYGLAADPRHARAVERLFEAKRRPLNLAVPLVAADTAQVTAAGVLTPLARRLADDFWPGPLALIIEAASSLDGRLLGGGTSVAVRVPAHAVARALARAFDHPITATSANHSARPAPATARAVVDSLGSAVNIVLDAGPTPGGAPSTIVDARGTLPILVRAGIVPWDRVLQSLA